ncbi:xanthine dehydrogenase family protein molybdopterin-binding subunit [Thalassotalea agarivorans]|uniref:Isoquinoline 1-oxidoreductase, beta subunit n=1 Tax=Thalassotalea agarivorans TaxID=349064 RepID=A0A1H9ZHC0_THASX|nr:molybdopterin cofactor-binding domain-containing protein [Thalassotalea agarivorans]SES80715.1 isoquinoline 1-oxidoreductase, beta subunit [Thalassotalea agarivorans]
MKTIENVSRRSFLKRVGASSSALVLGVQLPSLGMLPKALAATNKSVFAPNVYVQVTEDNKVQVICHRSEMGQGIRTSIPMIVADEIEAEWQQIEVIQGLGDAKYGSQNTDGSRSIRDFYQPLREAGASARMMLEQAAAKVWKVSPTKVQAMNGKVYLAKSNKSLSYGELVPIAINQEIPEKSALVLKKKSQFKFIGKKDIPLVDGKDIAAGTTVFGFDVELPNMRYAVIARPPVLGASVKSLNAEKANGIAGVVDVIQLDALEEPAAFKPLGGVAVIATNTWAAMKGREALEIEWSESEHDVYNSPAYKEALKESCITANNVLRKKGDVEAALKAATKSHTADYFVPSLIHVPMEPPAATAHFHDGIMDIWACTQTPQSSQGTVAAITGLKPENVNVNVTLLGGGFGRKSKPDFVVEAAVLSKQLEVPVKVCWTREDEVKNGYYQAVSYQRMSAGFNNEDKVTAWHHQVTQPPISATFAKGSDIIGGESNLGLIDTPFDIANIQASVGKIKAHTRIGWLRSVNNINHAFAASSFADELAHEAKADSKDFLLSLIGQDRKIDLSKENASYGNYGETIEEYPIDTARHKACVEKVAAMSKWGQTLPAGHALGIAVHRSFCSYVACVVEVSTNKAGKVRLENIWMAADCGTVVNPERAVSQMEGAAIFGISLTYFGEITAENGAIVQGNFDDYPVARMSDVPPIHVEIIENDQPPGGVGEPGVPPIAPAICNAIFKATGERYRELPLKKYGII